MMHLIHDAHALQCLAVGAAFVTAIGISIGGQLRALATAERVATADLIEEEG